MSILSMRLYDTDGATFLGFLPDIDTMSCNQALNDTGSFVLSYATNGVNASLLQADSFRQLAVHVDGVERYRFLVEEDDWSQVGDTGTGNTFNVTGRGLAAWLSQGLVYPVNGVGNAPAAVSFAGASAGNIMGYLVTTARTRGCFPNLTFTFTNTLDSAGNAWTNLGTVEFPAGTDILSVLNTLVNMGMCDFRMNGNELQIYNPGTTMAPDKTATVILRAGRDVKQSQRKRTKRDLGTVFLVQGDNGTTVERSDSTAITTYGRIEKSINQGGVEDTTMLNSIGDAYLTVRKVTKSGKNITVVNGSGGPQPFTDYVIGDKVSLVVPGAVPESLRVQTLAVSCDNTGVISFESDLGDKFIDLEAKLAQQLSLLSGGSSVSSYPISGVSDSTTPVAPAAPTLTSVAYNGVDGTPIAIVTATIVPPTTNTDGSSAHDVKYLFLRWRYADALVPPNPGDWVYVQGNAATVQAINGLRTGVTVQIQASAMDTSQNQSAWSASASIATASDTTPPGQPSTPTVSTKLGQLYLSWDGLLNGGGAQPSDYDYTEVHMSTSSGFTPSASTLITTFRGKSDYVFTNLVYNTTYYFVLRSLDFSNNISAQSVQVSGVPLPLVRTDLSASSVTYNEIAYKDDGNIVADGSFESSVMNALRVAQAGTSWYSEQIAGNLFHGATYMVTAPDAAQYKIMSLTPNSSDTTKMIPVVAGDSFYARYASRLTAIPLGTGSAVTLVAQVLLQGGTYAWFGIDAPLTTAGVWTQVSGVFTMPANAVSVVFYLQTYQQTANYVLWDAVEIRKIMSTVLIQDAAITNAKIANLAVNDAKINDLSVGKITAGTLAAAVVLSGSIKTSASTSVARVEIDSAGIRLYSASAQTVNMDATTGNVSITGSLQTALSGQRVSVNASSVTFYSGFSGEITPSFIQAGASSTAYLQISSPSYTGNTVTAVIQLSSTSTVGYVNIVGNLVVSGQISSTQGATFAGLSLNSGGHITMSSGDISISTSGSDSQINIDNGFLRVRAYGNNQLRLIDTLGQYGVIHRNDGFNYWMLVTAAGNPDGTYNSFRPFNLDIQTGNIILGHQLLVGAGSASSNGDIGAARSGGASGVIYLGPNTRYLYYSGTQYIMPSANLVLNGTTITSDRRVKANIADLPTGTIDKLLSLKPSSYNMLDEDGNVTDTVRYGFIAQDVLELYPEIVTKHDLGMMDPNTPDGEPPLKLMAEYGLDYNSIIALLVKSVQEQQGQLAALTQQMKDLVSK